MAWSTSGGAATATQSPSPTPSARLQPAASSLCQNVVNDESGWVNCMLNAMTVPEKVGQLFVLNAYGTSATDTTPANVQANQELYGPSISTIQDLINAYHPGGLIYFTWANDLSDPNQVVGLSNGVQQAALAQDVPSPLLISTDQEEGWILRIGSPATVFPGNMAVGATRDLGLANQNSAITGQELRAMGINVDNAPVVDVNTNQLNPSDGVRAFGDQPGFVSDFATASVQGFQGPGGVAAVAKHWPGLGDTLHESGYGNHHLQPDTGPTRVHQFPVVRGGHRGRGRSDHGHPHPVSQHRLVRGALQSESVLRNRPSCGTRWATTGWW